MPYPSTISSLTDPQASDRLNNPSHSALHQSENTAIEEVQTFVGTLSSAVGTLVYDIRSANSNGGGHVQAANKGGTGQTSYSKGDMLVATSSSVVAKLAVGTVGQVLTVDPTQGAGIAWQSLNRTVINTASIAVAAGASSVETVLYAASVAGSVMGSGTGIRFTALMRKFNSQANGNFNIKAKLNGNDIASMTIADMASSVVGTAIVSGAITGNSTFSSQLGYLQMDVKGSDPFKDVFTTNNLAGVSSIASSVNSAALQNLTITGRYNTVSGSINSVLTGVFIVEHL